MNNKAKHTLATISMVIVIGLTYYTHTSLNSLLGDLNRLEQIASMGMSHQPSYEIVVNEVAN